MYAEHHQVEQGSSIYKVKTFIYKLRWSVEMDDFHIGEKRQMKRNVITATIFVCSVVSLHVQATNSIQLRRGTGSVTLVTASTGSYSLTFPSSGGSSNQVFTTDGSGTLSWTTPSGGGASLDDLTDAVLKSQPFDQYSIAIGVGWSGLEN
jgi:hypothetical protein